MTDASREKRAQQKAQSKLDRLLGREFMSETDRLRFLKRKTTQLLRRMS